MATNLISSISQVLSPELLTRIATALGLDKFLVEKAVSAGVPALFAAFSSRAATRDGADSLNRAIADQQPGLLTNIANMIGGANQSTLVDSGINSLSSLLGGPTTNALSSAVGKFAGIGGGGAKSLMGLLAPVAMGVLGQQQRSSGRSVSDILASQKDNIARAMPKGFADYLSGTGLLDDVASASGAAPRAAVYDAPPPKQWAKPASTAGGPSWALPALALAALGALAWYLLSGPTHTKVAETAPPPAPAESAPAPKVSESSPIETGAIKQVTLDPAAAFQNLNGVKVGDVDLGAQLTTAISSLRSSLEGIKDEATAQAAVPAIATSKDEINRVTGLISQLSPEMRKSLAGAVASVKPALEQMFSKALAIPGVGTVIKPAVDSVRAELDTLAAA